MTDDVRRKTISGTDAPAICGQSLWKTPADVWMSKKHPELCPVMDAKKVAELEWGNLLEPIIAAKYAEQFGAVAKPDPHFMLHTNQWQGGSPDFLLTGKKKGLEVKTASAFNATEWGKPGTDNVPIAYLLQCQHYMLLTGYEEWDVAVLIDNKRFQVYHLFADKELLKMLADAEWEFYSRYIAGKETPEFDCGVTVREYVKKKYPFHKDEKKIEVDPYGDKDLKAALLALREARAMKKVATDAEDKNKTIIMASMGDAAILQWPDEGLEINWKNIKDSTKVEWKSVAESALEKLDIPAADKAALIKTHSTPKPGVRRFTVKDKSGEDEED